MKIGEAELARAADAAGLGRCAISLAPLTRPRQTVAVGRCEAIYPASMIKTPLAVAVAVAERAGRLRWNDRIPVDAANLTVNDAPSPLGPGTSATVDELVELMLSRSDNIATNVLIDCVGREQATADLQALGFVETAVHRKLSGALPLIVDPAARGRNTHPAHEATALFVRLAADDLPGAARIRSALAQQYWNTKLTRGLRAGDVFEHKTGDTDEVSHDGGILTLETGESYALAVYTALASNDATDRRFGEFMRLVRPDLTEEP